MPPLSTDLRRLLEKKVVEAREAAEDAARGALKSLAVDRPEPFSHMSEDDREFRRALRSRQKQLGDPTEPLGGELGFELLVQEIAYEQWHRMLFARFLAENHLLMHPSLGVPVTLEECAELAAKEGEPDGWMLAARCASRMLPGIFRTNDPAVRVRFAPEGRQALERILSDLPKEVFSADDSLGWVYQFWQSKKKKEVNVSERKIGGADLPPVTQLFTEHYMVAFLLQNSLGAWWAGKYPDSPLLKEWEYLRYAEDGTPVAGTFEGWPETVAEVTMMDPCCGSGHFLVAGFEMLRRMREVEEGLSPKDAADAVLRDNLFGLELDGRCVQIAVFALALASWRVGGYRELPAMNIACSGVPARGTAEEWRALAQGDHRLELALERLYRLFKDANTLGSLIDPRRAAESDTLLGLEYTDIEPTLHDALTRFGGDDPAQRVFQLAAEDVARAARVLAARYVLVATNPPYAGQGLHDATLADFATRWFPTSKADLATMFVERCRDLTRAGGTHALVVPQSLRYLAYYRRLREDLLRNQDWRFIALLGTGAFAEIGGEVVNVMLTILANRAPVDCIAGLDVTAHEGVREAADMLLTSGVVWLSQAEQLRRPNSIVVVEEAQGATAYLGDLVEVTKGICTGDAPKWVRCFWELRGFVDGWAEFRTSVNSQVLWGGCRNALYWEDGNGAFVEEVRARLGGSTGAWIRGGAGWGRSGISVSRMAGLAGTLYAGELSDDSAATIIPMDPANLPAIWAFSESGELHRLLRQLNQKISVDNTYLRGVPLDLAHWTKVAAERYPNGLTEPHSDDPTQWLFKGNIMGSESPLHVAIVRLLGYSWPDQEPDALDRFSDPDGIVCLPPVGGERPAADRLLELLAAAYGDAWSHSVLEGLLAAEDASDLEVWLRDKFFASHCKLFQNRPFIWQVWDGRKDGFSALVNYHKLDRKLLERLIYTALQSWVDRQKVDAEQGVGGAEARQAAAEELKRKLELILEGEPPYDIHVRWKPLERQPIGWEPDINDGVRLNIRPFVEAGVLRSKFTVNWNKDRGKNPDGSERKNDLHFTVVQKREARAKRTSG